jgi:hypothetical protein
MTEQIDPYRDNAGRKSAKQRDGRGCTHRQARLNALAVARYSGEGRLSAYPRIAALRAEGSRGRLGPIAAMCNAARQPRDERDGRLGLLLARQSRRPSLAAAGFESGWQHNQRLISQGC